MDEIVRETIRAWTDGRGGDKNLFVNLLGNCLTDEQIAFVLTTMSDVCNECWNAPSGCQCWNDE